MSYIKNRRWSPINRSESPRRRHRSHHSRRSSPHREYSRERRRERSSRRERYECYYNKREKSRCLGVFKMCTYTKENDIRQAFSAYGQIEKIEMLYKYKTNLSRGYCFVYYENVEDAKKARNHCKNLKINGKAVKVEFSETNRAHFPTPGLYMGNLSDYNYEERHRRRRSHDSSQYNSRHRRDFNYKERHRRRRSDNSSQYNSRHRRDFNYEERHRQRRSDDGFQYNSRHRRDSKQRPRRPRRLNDS